LATCTSSSADQGFGTGWQPVLRRCRLATCTTSGADQGFGTGWKPVLRVAADV